MRVAWGFSRDIVMLFPCIKWLHPYGFDSGHINFGASNWCSMVFTETQFTRAFVGLRNRLSDQRNGHLFISLNYSTVTDFAKFLGWSTLPSHYSNMVRKQL